MSVEIINDGSLWDRFVDESSSGLLFHKWALLKTVEKYSGYKLLPYGVYKGEVLISVFPLFFKNVMGIKLLFSPPPQSGIPYMGFLLTGEFDKLKQNKKESYLNLIIDEIEEEIKKISPHYTGFSMVPRLVDMRPFKWNGYGVETGYTYIIDLTQDLDYIWKQLKYSMRNHIRKAEKSDIRIVEGEDVAYIYDFLNKRYLEQQMRFPVFSEEYLRELINIFPERIKIYYIENQGKIVGAMITQEYKRLILWMGSSRLNDINYGNPLMIWELIKKAKAQGYPSIEYSGAGVKKQCLFKSQFNPELELCFQLTKSSRIGKFAEWGYQSFIKRNWF